MVGGRRTSREWIPMVIGRDVEMREDWQMTGRREEERREEEKKQKRKGSRLRVVHLRSCLPILAVNAPAFCTHISSYGRI